MKGIQKVMTAEKKVYISIMTYCGEWIRWSHTQDLLRDLVKFNHFCIFCNPHLRKIKFLWHPINSVLVTFANRYLRFPVPKVTEIFTLPPKNKIS